MLVQSLDQENPWRREWQPPPVFLPGESHGWRSLAGYSPWGREESDMTERLHTHILILRLPWAGSGPLVLAADSSPPSSEPSLTSEDHEGSDQSCGINHLSKEPRF